MNLSEMIASWGVKASELEEEYKHNRAVIEGTLAKLPADLSSLDLERLNDALATIESAAYRARMVASQFSTYPKPR